MKLYLSGPMAGLPEHNFPAFEEARKLLRDAGYEVVCPAELGKHDGWTWEMYLRRDLRVMLDCDGVALLDGWSLSRGAKLEVSVASQVGLEISLVRFWLRRVDEALKG